MNFLFDKINITSIQFETGSQEVNVQCVVTQGTDTYKSELLMTHTDLNRLIGRIQQQYQEVDILNNMDCVEVEEGYAIYSINIENYFRELSVENFMLTGSPKQIRA